MFTNFVINGRGNSSLAAEEPRHIYDTKYIYGSS